jgi:hypothetical protein
VPDFHFIQEAQELASVVINTKYSPERLRENLYYVGMRLVDLGRTLPINLQEIIEKLENGNLRVINEVALGSRERLFLSKMVTRLTAGMIIAALLLSYTNFNASAVLFWLFYLPLTIVSLGAFLLTFRKDRRK